MRHRYQKRHLLRGLLVGAISGLTATVVMTQFRHDYHVEASGGFAAAQYVSAPVTVEGITLPTKRRAYMRDKDLLPFHDPLMVSIDISDVSFS